MAEKYAEPEELSGATASSNVSAGSILHVVVVGFHHKRGCQVDFSYPPLIAGQPQDSMEVPSEWKHLPFLALPDGAHNYEEDAIYFHLPGRGKEKSTVYGISCYMQIKTQDLLCKSADVTRGTVQKCVCVLSKLPLYGLIHAKLELITHAYFSERDFSKTDILQEFYESLNSSIPSSLPDDSQVFLGLSLQGLVMTFKHKILVLFKLLLLERRVLFYTSPVRMLCHTLLAIVSLFPGMIERGLEESACPKHYNPRISKIELQDYGINTEEYLDVKMSHVPNYQQEGGRERGAPASHRSRTGARSTPRNLNTNSNKDEEGLGRSAEDGQWSHPLQGESDSPTGEVSSQMGSPSQGGVVTKGNERRKTDRPSPQGSAEDDSSKVKIRRETSVEEELIGMIDQELFGEAFDSKKPKDSVDQNPDDVCSQDSSDSNHCSRDTVVSSQDTEGNLATRARHHPHSASTQSADSGISNCQRSQMYEDGVGEMRMERFSGVDDYVVLPNTPKHKPMDVDQFGFPLAIFGKGSLCHPYMSLQQHDLLQDVNVRSFLIGATNALFKHQRHLMDVIVEVDEGKVNISDAELKKQLSLSTADLRFADFLIKNVSENMEANKDVFLDGTGWEGSDEWIRAQFKLYVLSLLSTCTSHGTFALPEYADFNESFVQAWKTTHNFRMWNSTEHTGIDQVHTGHPFHGQLSVNDMKIRLSSVMQTTDRGKRLNSALNRTGSAMMHTGKVVGEALTSAKSAVSSWLYGLANEWKEEEDKQGEDEKKEREDSK